jgi:tetratricopeptide (TPR) repeat protein
MKAGAWAGLAFSILICGACGLPALAACPPSQQQPQVSRAVQSKSISFRAHTAPKPSPLPMTPFQREETLGDTYMIRKMFHHAIAVYSDLLQEDPKNEALLNKVGIAYQQLELPKLAERYYKKAAKADKHSAIPINNWGTVEFGFHHYGAAIKRYKRAIRLDPSMASAYSNLGYAYLGRRKYQAAVLAFRRAIVIDPSYFEDRGVNGQVIESRGNQPPGLLYYLLAKSFAMLGDVAGCAHYLKMARDEDYKKFIDARKDPAFRKVLRDPRIHAILFPPPAVSPGDALSSR